MATITTAAYLTYSENAVENPTDPTSWDRYEFEVPAGCSSMQVFLVGGGGSGAACAHSLLTADNYGGGGGGGGGSVSGTLSVSVGDIVVFTTEEPGVRDSTPAGSTGFARSSNGKNMVMTHTPSNTVWTARGGTGGGAVDSFATTDHNADGGSGGTFNITGATATGSNGGTGGDGGRQGSAALDGNGSWTAGTKGALGVAQRTDGSDLNSAGGGGGTPTGVPAWVNTLISSLGDPTPAAGDGGNGGNTGQNTTVASRGATDTDTTFLSFDGKGTPVATFDNIGCGGGGAGAPYHDGNTNGLSPGWGGAGGQPAAIIQYTFESNGPTITLLGSNPLTLDVGSQWIDPGATAVDDIYGNTIDWADFTVTHNIPLVDGLATAPGTYTVTYSVDNAEGITNTATRSVTVADASGPTITLAGSLFEQVVTDGTWSDAGYTATDNVDGDVTNSVSVSYKYSATNNFGAATDTTGVNTAVEGYYYVIYSVSDAAGNSSQEIRTVSVTDVTFAISNTSGATPVKTTGTISFSHIQGARQLFKNSASGSVTRATVNNSDAGLLFDRDITASVLKDWFIDHGFSYQSTNRTYESDITPGDEAGSGLFGKSGGTSTFSISDFYGYATLTMRMQAVPETYNVYRNAANGQFRVWCWGAASGQTYSASLYRPSSLDQNAGWENKTGISASVAGTWSSLGGRFQRSALPTGGSSTVAGQVDPATTTYYMKLSWKNHSTGGTVNYGATSTPAADKNCRVVIGQSGSSDTSFSKVNARESTIFRWGSSTSAKSGTWSESTINYVTFAGSGMEIL